MKSKILILPLWIISLLNTVVLFIIGKNANGCFATLEMPDCILLDKDKLIVAVGNMDAPEKMYADFKSAII